MRYARTLIGALVLAVALAATSVAMAAKAPSANSQKAPAAAPAPAKLKASAALNIGQVKPKAPKATKAGAGGRFVATIEGKTMKWTLTYKQLSGPAVAAHLHAGARGVNSPVPVISLCDPSCTSGATGTVELTDEQLAKLKAGGYYVNVHTAKNPGGEIRGQVLSVK